jgi:hypothetical protein
MPAETSPPAGWRPPRLGNYELTSPNTTSLGRNKVYKAVDTRRRRPAALKLLAQALTGGAAHRFALRRKVQLAARLRHNNVLTVYEFGEANGSCFLATELVEAADLLEHVRFQGPLNADEARRLTVQAARALHQATKQGVPLPLVSPASFVLAQQDNQATLKFLPLDLLQEPSEGQPRPLPEEFRAPEETGTARDVRSAIFSLGATLFFLLTGRAPNPNEREWGPLARARATGPLLEVLQRTLARDPKARYQTPAALLQDLEGAGQRPAAGTATLKMTAGRAGAGPAKKRAAGLAGLRRPGAPRWLLAVLVFLVVAMGVTIAVLAKRLSDTEQTVSLSPAGGGRTEPNNPQDAPAGDGGPPVAEQPQLHSPALLYPGAAALNVKELHREFQGPWATPVAIPPDAPVYRVRRLAVPDESKSATTFETLAAACTAAAPGKVTVIEIHDNGPLHEAPLTIANRSLVLRAGPGYRPLIVWDVERSASAGGHAGVFLSLEGGDLTLGNLDLAVDWTERERGPACLVRVANGELLSWGSTFSVAGQHKAGVTLVRFEGAGPERKRCRLTRCVGRGDNITALDLRAPSAEVMLDNCLLVGGDRPLLRYQAPAAGESGATLRLIRSTLIASKDFCQVQGKGAAEPALSWMLWDTLIARRGRQPDGVLLDLPAQAGPTGLRWRALNSLYAGWKTLLSGRLPIAVDDESAWRKRWQIPAGDRLLAQPWETLTDGDPAEAPALFFATEATPFAFAATFGPGLVGCDLMQLPWTRTNWLGLAYRRFIVPEVDVLKDGPAPGIPANDDGKYHGGRLDLDKVDLGAHLTDILKKQELGPVVVLHLAGSGPRKTSPVRIKNASLMLYFEPAKKGHAPLVLVPDAKIDDEQNALFQVEGGSLEILGGELRLPDDREARLPHYLIHVWGGNLRIHGARLEGPLLHPPDSYWGLIRLEGSGQVEPEMVRGCTLHQSVLLTSRVALHLAGIGTRARLQDSLIVAGGHALHIQPGRNAPARLNTQCTLENCTIAARQAAVCVEDTPAWAVLADPIVLQTRANVFLNPFAGPGGEGTQPAGVFLYQGLALPRGVAAWQGEADVFDRRLFTYVWAAGADGRPVRLTKPQTFTVWERVWGPLGDRRPILDVPFNAVLKLDRPQLDQLRVPAHPSLRDLSPGAPLERLGLMAKAGG